MYKEGENLNRDISKIKNYLERTPDAEIWVVSGNLLQAKLYWGKISKELGGEQRKPYLVSSRASSIDGLNSQNALILLCGRWWTNLASQTEAFKWYLKNARGTIPIGEL